MPKDPGAASFAMAASRRSPHTLIFGFQSWESLATGIPGKPDFGLLGWSPPWQVLAFPGQAQRGGG